MGLVTSGLRNRQKSIGSALFFSPGWGTNWGYFCLFSLIFSRFTVELQRLPRLGKISPVIMSMALLYRPSWLCLAQLDRDSQICPIKLALAYQAYQKGPMKYDQLEATVSTDTARQAQLDRHNQTGLVRQAQLDRPSQIYLVRQAQLDRPSQTGLVRQAQLDRLSQTGLLREEQLDRPSQTGLVRQAQLDRPSWRSPVWQIQLDRPRQISLKESPSYLGPLIYGLLD